MKLNLDLDTITAFILIAAIFISALFVGLYHQLNNKPIRAQFEVQESNKTPR